MSGLLRLRILTSSRDTHPGEAERLCLEEDIAAVGWGIGRRPTSWKDYYEAACARYSRREANTVRRIAKAELGTYVWFRDRQGEYHLGRVDGPWSYRDDDRARELDIFNTRACTWRYVGPAMQVPGAVVRAFTGPGTAVCQIKSSAAARFSTACWNGTSPSEGYTTEDVVRELLDDVDAEDLVALYLQHVEGVVIVPPDRKRGHPAYDLEFVGPTRRRGLVQVKTGSQAYDFASLPNGCGEKWAFVASERIAGDGHHITVRELAGFLDEAGDWLPERLSRWAA